MRAISRLTQNVLWQQTIACILDARAHTKPMEHRREGFTKTQLDNMTDEVDCARFPLKQEHQCGVEDLAEPLFTHGEESHDDFCEHVTQNVEEQLYERELQNLEEELWESEAQNLEYDEGF